MYTFVTVLNHLPNAARLRITKAICSLSLLVFCLRELQFSLIQNQSIPILIRSEDPLFQRGAKTSHLASFFFFF